MQQQKEALVRTHTWNMCSSWPNDWPEQPPTKEESGNNPKTGYIDALKKSLNGRWKKQQLERQESHGHRLVTLAGYAVGQWTT
jgi:hypothetical protein